MGEVPMWDVSKVRPAGARLKIFGGSIIPHLLLIYLTLLYHCLNTMRDVNYLVTTAII